MIRYLALWSNEFGPLRVFESLTFRVAAGLALAFVLSLLLGPRFLRWLRAQSATEDMAKDSATLESLHAGKTGTPTMGGLLIVLTMILVILLTCDPANPLVQVGLLGLLGFGALGFVDDYYKLKGWGKGGLGKRQKLLGQCVLCVLLYGVLMTLGGMEKNAGVWNDATTQLLIPFTKWKEIHPDLGWLYLPFFMLVVIGSSNAVNLTDGLDGLASGVVIMTALTYMVFSYVSGNEFLCGYFRIPHVVYGGELAVFCAVMVGAVMGFLWFNAHPASVFMGDTGSLALGAAIGYIALVVKQELVLIVAGGIFVAEALSVLIQVVSFKTTGKRVFKCAPLHHHLEFSGWHENKVVVRLWMIGAILAALGLATLKMH